MSMKRQQVWLGVGAIVQNRHNEWLVVKKTYGGLKDVWSIPAGFVDNGEAIHEAAIREVKEETGIDCVAVGLVGFRSGVIREEISDNMAILLCTPVDDEQPLRAEPGEIADVQWLPVAQLAVDPLSSVMLKEMAAMGAHHYHRKIDTIRPGDVFGYTSYTLFFGERE